MKKHIKLALKIIVSGVAIYYVVSKLDFQLIITVIKSAKIWLMSVALFFYVLSLLFAAERLNFLFRKIDLKLSFFENIKLYWLGIFYNLFLPGGVGGDGYKIYFIDKYLNIKIKKSLGAILSDRISGLTVVFIFLLFFSYSILNKLIFQHSIWILMPSIKLLFQHSIWILIPFSIICFWVLLRYINFSFSNAFFPVFGLAFIVQFLQMATAIVILTALNVYMLGDFNDYLFLFFLSAVMGSIPITLGGLGIRELTFLIGAQQLGIDQNIAVSLSLLFYAVSVITALPGIFYSIKPEKIYKNFRTP